MVASLGMNNGRQPTNNVVFRQGVNDFLFHGIRHKISAGTILANGKALDNGVSTHLTDNTAVKLPLIIGAADRFQFGGVVHSSILLIVPHKYLVFLPISGALIVLGPIPLFEIANCCAKGRPRYVSCSD